MGRADPCVSGAIWIPVYQRDKVAALAIISSEDLERVARHRWQLSSREGYARSGGGHRGRYIYMHRLVLGLPDHAGHDPRQADHINGERLDNRRSNLRIVTGAQNAQNLKKSRVGFSSQYRGVYFSNNKKLRNRPWVAEVKVGKKNTWVGSFLDEISAAMAAAEYRAKVMPFCNEDRHRP